jgi:hypothetical protein
MYVYKVLTTNYTFIRNSATLSLLEEEDDPRMNGQWLNTTLGWVVNGGRCHAELQGELIPRSCGTYVHTKKARTTDIPRQSYPSVSPYVTYPTLPQSFSHQYIYFGSRRVSYILARAESPIFWLAQSLLYFGSRRVSYILARAESPIFWLAQSLLYFGSRRVSYIMARAESPIFWLAQSLLYFGSRRVSYILARAESPVLLPRSPPPSYGRWPWSAHHHRL